MADDGAFFLYGEPPAELAEPPAGARQMSPLSPGSEALEAVAPASLNGMIVAAPPGSVERRYVLALALKALKPRAPLLALAPKDKGGARLGGELKAFGCVVEETGRRHHRLCRATRPDAPLGLEAAVSAGKLRFDETLGRWTQPGAFSWNRIDPGSRLLISALPALSGRGADLGCGIGTLAEAVLASLAVTGLDLVELDRRALDAARRNILDARAAFHWADARAMPSVRDLDFVVTNPPFHDAGAKDKALGQAFIRTGHAMLRRGGVLWLVANRHLPYEAGLRSLFARVSLKAEGGGFKVYEAVR